MSSVDRSQLIKKIIFWSIIIGAIIALFIPTIAYGQSNVQDPCEVLGGCLPGTDSFRGSGLQNGVVELVLNIVYILIFISGAISVLFIVLGGYTMITSNGSQDNYKKGLSTVQNAVIGLVITILSLGLVTVITRLVPGLDLSSGSNGSSAYQTCVANGGGQACQGR